MKHFEDIIFIWIRTYRKIFKSALCAEKCDTILTEKNIDYFVNYRHIKQNKTKTYVYFLHNQRHL